MELLHINEYVDYRIQQEQQLFQSHDKELKEMHNEKVLEKKDGYLKITASLANEFKDYRTTVQPEKTGVFCYYPLAHLSKGEQVELFDHIIQLKITDEENEPVGNKMVHNLKKLPMICQIHGLII